MDKVKRSHIIDVWHKDSLEFINPDEKCFSAKSLGGLLLFDYAYKTIKALKAGCFWFSPDYISDNPKIVEFDTTDDYIKAHCKEIEGMNPFWSIGRVEFISAYCEKFDKNIIDYLKL